jgi:hypothetical protein
VDKLMNMPAKAPQRTGWVILVLMAATNFLPWMEPLIGETLSADLVAPGTLRTSVGACLLGAALVAITWLAGRHAMSPLPRSVVRPRLLGFRLALGSSALNIAIGCVLAYRGSETAVGPFNLGLVGGVLWFAAILPAEVVAAYLTGRGSVRRLASTAETPNAEIPGPRYASQTS